MFRNYLLLLLLTIGFITLPGCSLFSSDNEEGEETSTEEVSDEGGDVVETEEGSSESDEEVATSEEGSSSSGTEELAANTDEEEVIDEYPDDDYGGDSATTTASSDLPDQPIESSSTSGEETLYVAGDEGSASTDTSEATASTDTLIDSSSSGGDSLGFVPVKKMKRTPYNAGGALINRLYLARSGDTMSSVAEKIYGDSSKKSDLNAWNNSLAGRSLKVGDKVYYNSARNPADSSQIMLYYEEAGIAPQYYTAKSGDSIRKVSQQLLGHPNSWMEVWATNEVESKWQIPEGTSLRYWPDGTTAAPVQQTQAANEEAAAPADDGADEMGAPPVEGGQNVASNTEETAPAPTEDLPPADEPAPSDDMGAGAQVAQNEEPPPPPQDMAPPPPPPSDAAAPTDEASGEEGGLASLMNGQDDTTMIVVLGGLLLVAAFILLIFLKRGRKKVNYS